MGRNMKWGDNMKIRGKESGRAPVLLFFDLATFMVMSAKLCFTEPPIYGPLRLLVAVSKLADIPKHIPGLQEDSFLDLIKKEIDEKIGVVSWDSESFKKLVDDLVVLFTNEIKKRS
jgi:hypothetical protein